MGGAVSRRVFPYPEPPTYSPKPPCRMPKSTSQVKLSQFAQTLNLFWINTNVMNHRDSTHVGYDICCCYLRYDAKNEWGNNGDRPVLLISHENAEDLGGTHRYAAEFCRLLRVNVIIYDYPGYGLSSGVPTEEGCQEAILAVYNYLETLNHKSIILFGKSLGTGPSIWLATQRRVAGIIIQSGFSSIYNVYLQRNTAMPFMGDMFLNAERMPEILDPILVIHGEVDDLIAVDQARHLASLATHSTNMFVIPGGNHNNLERLGGDNYHVTIKRFLVYTWALRNASWLALATSSKILIKLDTIRQEGLFTKNRWPKLAGLPKIYAKESLAELVKNPNVTVDQDSQLLARSLIVIACFIKADRTDKLLGQFTDLDMERKHEVLRLIRSLTVDRHAKMQVVEETPATIKKALPVSKNHQRHSQRKTLSYKLPASKNTILDRPAVGTEPTPTLTMDKLPRLQRSSTNQNPKMRTSSTGGYPALSLSAHGDLDDILPMPPSAKVRQSDHKHQGGHKYGFSRPGWNDFTPKEPALPDVTPTQQDSNSQRSYPFVATVPNLSQYDYVRSHQSQYTGISQVPSTSEPDFITPGISSSQRSVYERTPTQITHSSTSWRVSNSRDKLLEQVPYPLVKTSLAPPRIQKPKAPEFRPLPPLEPPSYTSIVKTPLPHRRTVVTMGPQQPSSPRGLVLQRSRLSSSSRLSSMSREVVSAENQHHSSPRTTLMRTESMSLNHLTPLSYTGDEVIVTSHRSPSGTWNQGKSPTWSCQSVAHDLSARKLTHKHSSSTSMGQLNSHVKTSHQTQLSNNKWRAQQSLSTRPSFVESRSLSLNRAQADLSPTLGRLEQERIFRLAEEAARRAFKEEVDRQVTNLNNSTINNNNAHK